MAFVAAIDQQAQTLRVTASDDRHPELVETLRQALSSVDLTEPGILAHVIGSEGPIVINDISINMDVPSSRQLLDHGSHAAAFFPLFSAGKVESVFALFARQKDFFDHEEVELLTELADNVSFALNHLVQAQRLNFLAYYDELTGLPKRALLMDRIDQQIVACRKDDKKLALVLLDIGRLRQINETLGRAAGDDVLLRVAERLRKCLDAQDTLARFDGKSFAVLMSPLQEEADVASRVERTILPALNEPFTVGKTELRIAFVVAIAMFPADGFDADSLAANAEAALKKAKVSGQRYLFYAPSMNERVAEKLTLETKLRRALEHDEFVLHYQPKVELKTGRVIGLEALIRWQDPDSGLVPPGRFIPVLEETGLIVEAGSWVMQHAAAQFTAWRERGFDPPRVAVNVSALQLGQRDFVGSIERTVERYPLAAGGIDIEITESVLMEDFAINIRKLQAVKDMGLMIAIDDFGTGYSSLGYLSRLPIDALKIDRSFVMRMAEDPQEMAIVTTIISLAHALDLKVIAEGVETPNQAQLLRLLKCDQIQGYLVAKPLPTDEVRGLLDPRTTFRW
jgi:diguanylate cyclase (GGDEF)-like protein